MRKLNLIMIIVWSVLTLIIAVCLIAGIAYHRSGGVFGRSISQKLFEPGERELLLEKSFSSANIETIEVYLHSDVVDVFSSPDDNFHVKQYGRNLTQDRIISTDVEGSRFKIQPGENSRIINFGFMVESWVEVYVPSSYEKELDLKLTSGTIKVNRDLDLTNLKLHLSSGDVKSDYVINCAQADIKITSGSINLQKLTAPDFEIKLASGTLRIQALSGSGAINVTSGDIKLEDMDITDSLKVKVQSGHLKMNLSGDPSLQYQGNVTSGNIKTYFDVYYKDKRESKSVATIGDGPYKKLLVQVTSGNINIGHNGESQEATGQVGADPSWDFDDFDDFD